MILLTGGTGFVGSKVLPRLVATGQPIRMLSRGESDWKDSAITSLRQKGIDVIFGDLRDKRHIEKALDGCTCVVNCAGLMYETKDVTFRDVHVDAMRDFVARCDESGVKRFIHLSCLGAHEFSDSEYLRSRWESEQIVKKGKFFWTIFRPSFIFGDDCPLLAELQKILKKTPVLPVIGTGLNHIQPIWVEDVAECLVKSIYQSSTADNTYELVGKQSYPVTDFVQMIACMPGESKAQVNIPFGIAKQLARLSKMVMPNSAMSVDLLRLLTTEMEASPEPMQREFQINPQSFAEFLDKSMSLGDFKKDTESGESS
jgi:NADH dehydrogenase